MNKEKLAFLQSGYIEYLDKINADSKALWGKMNAQQMLEHVSDFFKVSTEKIKYPIITPEEHLPKFKAFLLSDKEFRENTKAPADIVAEEPISIRNNNMQEASSELKQEITEFIKYFENEEEKKTAHPVFGNLNYEEWVLLHNKHVMHHFKQFGLIS